eukprot:gene25888-33841_t
MMLEEKGWNILSDEITKLPILPQKREEVLLQLTKTDNNLIIRLKEFVTKQQPFFERHCGNSRSGFTTMESISHKCLTLEFLIGFYKEIIEPVDPKMRTKRVADKLIKPYTKNKGGSLMDAVMPFIYVEQLSAFIIHSHDNEFALLVNSLQKYFKDDEPSEIFINIDIFTIDQNNVFGDLRDGLTLKDTIENSAAVLVVLDQEAIPLTRLWCLYEIGSTPIEKLTLLTHGLDKSLLARAFTMINANNAKCCLHSDKDMIQRNIFDMMLRQKMTTEEATIAEAMNAFTRVLKLLLILTPTSYSAEIAALLARVL